MDSEMIEKNQEHGKEKRKKNKTELEKKGFFFNDCRYLYPWHSTTPERESERSQSALQREALSLNTASALQSPATALEVLNAAAGAGK